MNRILPPPKDPKWEPPVPTEKQFMKNVDNPEGFDEDAALLQTGAWGDEEEDDNGGDADD